MAKKKQTLPDIKNQDPLEPINIAELGSNSDPCFGIGYDLSTKECKLCLYRDWETDRKSTRLNSSHSAKSRMPSSA